MQVKQYLIESFRYNDHANKLALRKMMDLCPMMYRVIVQLQRDVF